MRTTERTTPSFKYENAPQTRGVFAIFGRGIPLKGLQEHEPLYNGVKHVISIGLNLALVHKGG